MIIKEIKLLLIDCLKIQNVLKEMIFSYSPGHPGGFLDAFINIYELISSLYFNKKIELKF